MSSPLGAGPSIVRVQMFLKANTVYFLILNPSNSMGLNVSNSTRLNLYCELLFFANLHKKITRFMLAIKSLYLVIARIIAIPSDIYLYIIHTKTL